MDNTVGRFKSYRLANNSIVNKLIAMDIEYNLMISESQINEKSISKVGADESELPMENRYYQAPEACTDSGPGRMIPISFQVSDTNNPDGFISLSEDGAKKLYLSLKESIIEPGDNRPAQMSSR